MANDYFPTRDIAWKLAMLEAVAESMFTGNISRAQTAGGVVTEFDPKTTSPDTMFERLRESILNDADFDENNPVHAKLLNGMRPGITRAVFT